jgi:hypothetical protein
MLRMCRPASFMADKGRVSEAIAGEYQLPVTRVAVEGNRQIYKAYQGGLFLVPAVSLRSRLYVEFTRKE